MRLLAVFDVLKHSATEDSTYLEEEEDLRSIEQHHFKDATLAP